MKIKRTDLLIQHVKGGGGKKIDDGHHQTQKPVLLEEDLIKTRKRALQELADQAQELDMGY